MKDEPYASVTWLFTLITTPPLLAISFAFGYAQWPPCDASLRFLSWAVGVAAAGHIFFQIAASQILKAKTLSLGNPAELVFQYILHITGVTQQNGNQGLNFASLLGASLVIAAFIYLAIVSIVKQRLKSKRQLLEDTCLNSKIVNSL